MNRRGPSLWSKKVAFPLERLASLIESSVWTDIESEKIWNDKYPRSTYQIWDSDPALGMSKLILQDIQFSCPWCDTQQTIPLGTWTEIHTTKTVVWSCASCQVKFNADTLSAKYLKDDLLEFNKTNNPWYHPYFLRRLTCRTVKGVIPGRFDVNPEETGNADLGFIFDTAWTNAYRESYNGGTSKPKKFGLFSRRNVEEKVKGVGDEGEEYLKMYPYWLKVPEEWKFPAACANSGKNGRGGWAASVDRQREASTMAGAKCAGCTAACTYEWGD